VASFCGIGGVTFVLVAFNAGLAAVLRASRGSTARRIAAAATGVALAASAAAWGTLRLAAAAHESAEGPRILAVDLAASGPETGTLARYIETSAPARESPPSLVIWPESALTTDIERDRSAWADVTRLVAGSRAPLLAGGPGSARRAGGGLAVYNSAHLVSPHGGLHSYHKRRPVPVAERWPSFLGAPPAGLASLDAGRDPTIFALDGARLGVLICFEITDPGDARALARRRPDFIVNLTNDYWFAAWHRAPHEPWARVRAVETGVPVVRVANAGLSAIFDRFGQEVASSRSRGVATLFASTVPAALESVYARTGDVFLAACLAAVGAGIVARVIRARTRDGGRSRATPVAADRPERAAS
jgi:apolipoprotein N-acyltransferase